ncbi:MAG: hypothetical protein R2716_11145 [Microthrixaceae bacterium]
MVSTGGQVGSGARVAPEQGAAPAAAPILEAIIGDTAPVDPQALLLPLADSVGHLFPGGCLRRGSAVRVSGADGATTLALALAAGPCRSGAWLGCAGFRDLGWEAASQVGLPLRRVVDVASGEAPVLAAMLDTFDLVLCGPQVSVGSRMWERLRARARERGAVIVAVDAPRDRADRSCLRSDVDVTVRSSTWEGLGSGWGNLSGRRIAVEVRGRGAMARPAVLEVLLGSGPPAVGPPRERLGLVV